MLLCFDQAKYLKRGRTMSIASLLFLCAPFALAQNNVGDLLDAGAKPITVEEFKRDIAMRTLVGPTASGGIVEMLYVSNGSIVGAGSLYQTPQVTYGPGSHTPISGEWKIGEDGRICTALRVSTWSPGGTMLPTRCQVWFKYGDVYFIADSDSDRLAKVLRRTVKQ